MQSNELFQYNNFSLGKLTKLLMTIGPCEPFDLMYVWYENNYYIYYTL